MTMAAHGHNLQQLEGFSCAGQQPLSHRHPGPEHPHKVPVPDAAHLKHVIDSLFRVTSNSCFITSRYTLFLLHFPEVPMKITKSFD